MADVASAAAVSPSTVSLFLRRPSAVSDEAGARIAGAIERLGYLPNLMAGGLAGAASRVVGVIVPSLRNAFFAETVSTIGECLEPFGRQTMIGHAEYSAEREEALVRAALAWSPAGIVLTGLHHTAATRRLLERAGVPVVEMWELGERPIDVMVGFSHHAVGRAAAEHLVARGRRRIVFLGARLQEDRRADQRAQGVLAAAAEAGLTAQVESHPAPATVEAGAILLGRALGLGTPPDAVVCSNDTVALGVLFECQRRGIRVPDDLAVVGFGDLGFGAWSTPTLTTIRPSGAVIGREVTRILLDRIEGRPADRVSDTGFSLVHRGSS
jgi:LacI family gluconate utilization system Gnt-I transcriptional repressor